MARPSTVLDEVETALRSEDWMTRAGAVRRAAGLLREVPEPPVVDRLARHLHRLSSDPKRDVREAVAVAAQYLNHGLFEVIIGRLVGDANEYVRRTAEGSLRQRRQLTRSMARQQEEVGHVIDRLNRLKARHGPEVSQQALEIGQAFYEAVAARNAHDILNVMTALQQSLRNLRETLGELPAAAVSHLDNAGARCQAVAAIARDMKELAEHTAPHFTAERLHAMVVEALGLVVDRFADVPDAPAVETTLKIDEHLTIDAPRLRLVRAFTNVIKNAFEAIAGTGALVVEAAVNDSAEVVLKFSDDGCGIAEEDVPQMFIPGTSTKKGQPGRPDNTGMGLAITRKIVEAECRGRIHMTSQEDVGTTVSIALPTRQERDEP